MGLLTEGRYKIADESNDTTTLNDVDDLVFDVEPNLEYEFEFVVPYKSAGSTVGIGLAVQCPTLDGSAYIAYYVEIPGAVAADGPANHVYFGSGISSDDVVQATGSGTANTVWVAVIKGILKNGSNAGQLKLRFKSEVAGTAVTIMEGAAGRLHIQPV